jgi:hypothetical protein
MREFESSGLSEVDAEDLTGWACALLRDRLKALTLFRGTAERIVGVPETRRIQTS